MPDEKRGGSVLRCWPQMVLASILSIGFLIAAPHLSMLARLELGGAYLLTLVGLAFWGWRRTRMRRFVDVCGVGDVAEGKGLGLTVDGLGIAVFRDGDRYHALLGRCPHADGPMGRGWVEDGEAVCPLHQWRFQLATGRCSTVSGRSLHKFRCKVVDGRVWVEV